MSCSRDTMATDSTCLGGNSASVPNSFIQLRHMRWKTFRECSTRPPAKLLWNFVLAGASKKSVASSRPNSESEPVLCIYFWYAEMKVSF
ncbi:PH domain-containing protein, partial [Dysosmobacter welbionis]